MSSKKLRSIMRWKTRLIVTARRRNAAGFTVTGPDGKTYQARTFLEAHSNLTVRMRCYSVAPWRITPTKKAVQ